MRNLRRGKAHAEEVVTPKSSARREQAFSALEPNTLLGSKAGFGFAAKFHSGALPELPRCRETSGMPPVLGLRSGSIRKEIIGHRLLSRSNRSNSSFGVRKYLRDVVGAFPLLQKQARYRGVGLVRHPLIQQSLNLLAEIGGVRETRKLEALQGVFRGREKKIPRRFGGMAGHVDLRYFCAAHNNFPVIAVKNTYVIGPVEICG